MNRSFLFLLGAAFLCLSGVTLSGAALAAAPGKAQITQSDREKLPATNTDDFNGKWKATFDSCNTSYTVEMEITPMTERVKEGDTARYTINIRHNATHDKATRTHSLHGFFDRHQIAHWEDAANLRKYGRGTMSTTAGDWTDIGPDDEENPLLQREDEKLVLSIAVEPKGKSISAQPSGLNCNGTAPRIHFQRVR